MRLKEIADLATGLSLVVTALTLIFAFWEHHVREKQRQLLNWQKVVVYKIIEDGHNVFDDIKINYIAETQQFLEFDIPKEEIQDGALKLVLMSLLETKLISISLDDQYVLNKVSLQENDFKELAAGEMRKRMNQPRLLGKLYEFLDRESGKYTIDQLYRTLEIDQYENTFDDFNVLLREMANRNVLVIARDDKIWLRSRVPQPQPQSGAKSPPPKAST